MSNTFKTILKHWIGESPSGDGYIVLPFNIEAFCRENDAAYAELKSELDVLKADYGNADAERDSRRLENAKLKGQLSDAEQICSELADALHDIRYYKKENEGPAMICVAEDALDKYRKWIEGMK